MRISTVLSCALLCACGETAQDANSPADSAVLDADADAELDANDADAGPLCTAAPASAEVSGMLPVGTFAASLAVFNILGGECGGARLLLLPSPAVSSDDETAWPKPWASVFLQQLGADAGPSGTARVVTDSAAFDQLVTNVSLTSTEPKLVGTLSIDDQGVKIQGTFRAEHCAPLDIFCP